MGLKLYRYINFNNKKVMVKFFNQSLPFIYILFNFFYRKFLVNPDINDKEILQFHKSGFTKIDISLKKEIEEYKDKFYINDKNQKNNSKKKIFELDKEYKKNLAIKIKKKIAPLITKLEKYFNCDVFISDIGIFRNYTHNDSLNLKVSHYGNHFHQDSYVMTYSKLFINLMDVNDDDGPLEIVPIENRNSFVKSFKYKDINNYNLSGDKTLIKKNLGKIGDCFLFSSPQIFHRAGVPKNYRDNMRVILVAIPKKISKELNKIDNEKLFENNFEIFQKFTKPYSIIKVIRLFFTHLKHKFNG